jgi:hypothetical protein
MWLPREPPPADLSALAPWCPAGVEDCEGLAYIVVDELHDGIAGLVVTAWPRVDERGRLRFGREAESTRVAAPAEALLDLLRAGRAPVVPGGLDEAQAEAMRTRSVEIGDVFAARLRAEPAPGDPAAWLQAPVLDLTAPAREVAKAQTSAALSGAVDAGYLDVVAEEMTGDARH